MKSKTLFDSAKYEAQYFLRAGSAGSLLAAGNGSYYDCFNLEFGLPEQLTGDCQDEHSFARIRGHNHGVSTYVSEFGLPWNSRKIWQAVIIEPVIYFEQNKDALIDLTPENALCRHHDYNVKLVGRRRLAGTCRSRPKRNFDYVRELCELTAAEAPLPPLPLPTPLTVQPCEIECDLHSFSNYESAQCVPGPPGSFLVVFRFEIFFKGYGDTAPRLRRTYPIFDTQLSAFIPGRAQWTG